MRHAEVFEIAEAALHRTAFRVPQRCASRASCFDYAAWNEERLIFV